MYGTAQIGKCLTGSLTFPSAPLRGIEIGEPGALATHVLDLLGFHLPPLLLLCQFLAEVPAPHVHASEPRHLVDESLAPPALREVPGGGQPARSEDGMTARAKKEKGTKIF